MNTDAGAHAHQPRCVAAAMLVRHGARGMTNVGLARLQHGCAGVVPGRADAAPPAFVQQWHAHEMEEITCVGEVQMHKLGRWFAAHVWTPVLASQPHARRESEAAGGHPHSRSGGGGGPDVDAGRAVVVGVVGVGAGEGAGEGAGVGVTCVVAASDAVAVAATATVPCAQPTAAPVATPGLGTTACAPACFVECVSCAASNPQRPRLTWHSSAVPRVLESGRSFWRGVTEAICDGVAGDLCVAATGVDDVGDTQALLTSATSAPACAASAPACALDAPTCAPDARMLRVTVPSEPVAYAGGAAEADAHFRTWLTEPEYRATLGELKTCAEVVAAANAVAPRVHAVYQKLARACAPHAVSSSQQGVGGSIAAHADGCDANPAAHANAQADAHAAASSSCAGSDAAPLATRYYQLTYVKEELDCEIAWPSSARWLADGGAVWRAPTHGPLSTADDASRSPESASPAFIGCAAIPGVTHSSTGVARGCGTGVDTRREEGAATWPVTGAHPPLLPPKVSFVASMSEEEDEFVRAHARWVLDLRFFKHPRTKPFAGRIGGALVLNLLHNIARSPAPVAALYSCHDYTLLCMLAALRYGRHPAECIDFAAFLLWRVWEEAEAAPASTRTAADRPRRTVSLHLCASPYPDARRGHPTYLRPRLVPIFEDVPVEALQHLADGWRADLVRAFPVLASNAWVQQPPAAAAAPTKRYGAC